MGTARKPPQAALDDVTPAKVQRVVGDLLTLHQLGPCETDEQVEERIGQYFQLCQRSSIRPGVESLAAALHVDRTTIWYWSQGRKCSKRRAAAIQSAKAMITAYLEQAVSAGLINPVSGIFLMKNWAGYSDRYLFETAEQHSSNPYEALSPEEIARRIEQDIPIDDGILADVREPI